MSTNNPPCKRLFIGGVPYDYREGQLLSLFVSCGKVIDVRIIKNKWGRSRGMAYLEFDQLEEALEAKKKFHNFAVSPDRTIIVDFAKPDPFLTPEGKARHQVATQKKKNKSFASGDFSRAPSHLRQSVFESRHFGSHVGAKFARHSPKKTTSKS